MTLSNQLNGPITMALLSASRHLELIFMEHGRQERERNRKNHAVPSSHLKESSFGARG